MFHKILRILLTAPLALILLFEEWGWAPLAALMARLARLPIWARLEKWLIEYCKRENTDKVPTREVQQFGPGGLRDKVTFTAAVQELAELGRARLVQDGKKRQIQIHPELLA